MSLCKVFPGFACAHRKGPCGLEAQGFPVAAEATMTILQKHRWKQRASSGPCTCAKRACLGTTGPDCSTTRASGATKSHSCTYNSCVSKRRSPSARLSGYRCQSTRPLKEEDEWQRGTMRPRAGIQCALAHTVGTPMVPSSFTSGRECDFWSIQCRD